MITKLIMKSDTCFETVKDRVQAFHQRAKKNRGAEMMEVAIVVGVVIAMLGAFEVLQNAVGDSITNAANKVRTKK
jgi:Flp pilus assembly pilin Flp